MKKSRGFNLVLIIVLTGITIIGSSWTYGNERGERPTRRCGNSEGKHGLNLTDQQKEQMKTLRLNFIKEMTPYKNDLNVKTAELKAASTGDNVDQKAVFKLIDEISKVKTEIAKKKFTNKQKMRALLTDEQKIIFDSHPGKRHKGKFNEKSVRKGKPQFHKGMREHRGRGFKGIEADDASGVQG